MLTARSLVETKKKDPRAFVIPCTIGSFNFAHALYDLRVSINQILLVMYKQLGVRAPKTNVYEISDGRAHCKKTGWYIM